MATEAQHQNEPSFQDFEAAAESGDLDAMLEGLGSDGAPEPKADDEPAAKEPASTDGDADGKEGAAKDDTTEGKQDEPATKDDDDEPAGVQTRDGKHVIPYSVLEGERKRNADMAAQLSEMREQLQKFTAKPEGDQTGSTDTTDTGQEFDLDKFEEEYGKEMTAPLRAMHSQMKALQARLEESDSKVKSWERERETTAVVTTEEAIDLVFAEGREPGKPSILREWAESDPVRWDRALAADKILGSDPEWQDAPLVERFEKAVQMVQAMDRGSSTTSTKPEATTTNPKDDGKGKGAPSGKQDTPPARSAPFSQSDLPGGVPPDQTQYESVERMDPTQLAEKFAGMSVEEQDAYLSAL